MKIHEYQAKEILEQYNVAVPAGKSATNVDDAVEGVGAVEGTVEFRVVLQLEG